MAATKKPAQPMFTDEEQAHLDWFYSQDPKHFNYLALQWNERNLDIKLKKKRNYDDYLNYFKQMPARHVNMLVSTAQDVLTTEGYAALLRWRDIVLNPHRIDKIHQAGLVNKKKKNQNDIVAMAAQNDRLGVLKATRDKLAIEIEKGAGSRDTALLVREMTEVMTQIADYEKRLGPKAETELGQLMRDMPGAHFASEHVTKRKKDAGARNTSFQSRSVVTIDDLNEDDDE
ncbi:MAG TPA: hypothetical protein PK911_05035 [Candidatus Saccharibacteria bacterium]|nr:hypothetical protein [Candidatus Saccharibacteria bacterium]